MMVLLIMIIMINASCGNDKKISSTEKEETQVKITSNLVETDNNLEKKLNEKYNEILKKYSKNKVFLEKFIVSQQSWTNYKEANLDALFPEDDKKMSYGSGYNMCYLLFLNEMIEIRIKDLDKWLIDTEPPCDCSYGSYD